MKAYLITACGAVFLSVIVSFLLPEGKLGKTITVILRMVCISILISPIFSLFGFSSSGYADYTDYRFICNVYSENQSSALEDILLENYGVQTECTVNVVYEDGAFRVQSVEVCLLQPKEGIAEKIYEYLQENDYINITVYE